MRLQSSHDFAARGPDPYFTPSEATLSLLHIEHAHIKDPIWEPACGNGAISQILISRGYTVFSSDIEDYGYEVATVGVDFLTTKAIPVLCQAIVTNPPFKFAQQFAEKAIKTVPYTALLLRTNFLESVSRLPFFRTSPPSRIWVSSRRLPMMHRLGWSGPEAPSNTCFAWFVWDAKASAKRLIGWFDWQECVPQSTAGKVIDLSILED